MSLFDGLLAKVEGAVSSAESRAAGLVTSAEEYVGILPRKPAASPVLYDFVGPIQPGKTRPAPKPLPTAPAGPPQTTFNMVEDAATRALLAPGDIFGITSWLTPKTTTPAPIDYSADVGAWGSELSKWNRILQSLDKSMNQRDGRADLSSRFSAWQSGPYQAAVNLLSSLAAGSDVRAQAQVAYEAAVGQAQNLQTAFQSAWGDFAASGVPSVSDYFKAPVTAVTETGKSFQTAAYKAVSAVEKAAAPSLASAGALLQYGPWILGGLAVLYASSFLPRPRRD